MKDLVFMLIELLSDMLSYVLALYIPFLALLSLLYKKPKKAKEKAKNVKIVIVTIGSNRVRKALFDTISNVKKMFSEYEVFVVTDEGAELVDELSKMGINLVIVPDSYTCKAKYKARAIQYFIENYVKNDEWYVFLDDDSYPLDDNFLYELPFFESKGYVAGNGILVPRKGKSLITYLADAVRTTLDKTVYRFTLGVLRRPVVMGMHGELLIVKGWVLKEIGFNFNTITEDSRFAAELFRKKYKTFQTTTQVSILSPNNIKHFWRQRSRWILGVAHDFREYPTPVRELNLIGLIILFTAIPGYIFMMKELIGILLSFIITMIKFFNPDPIFHLIDTYKYISVQLSLDPVSFIYFKVIKPLFRPSVLSILTIYIGYFMGGKGRYRILTLLLAPIFVFLEILAPWYAILFYRRKNNREFYVIDKNF